MTADEQAISHASKHILQAEGGPAHRPPSSVITGAQETDTNPAPPRVWPGKEARSPRTRDPQSLLCAQGSMAIRYTSVSRGV